MKRLTDKRTAEALKRNVEGLMSKGIDVPIDDLRYIKLARYEDEEEGLPGAYTTGINKDQGGTDND